MKNLYPVEGTNIPNNFHLTIFTTSKIVYAILKYLKEMYKTHYNRRIEIKHTSTMDNIFLSFYGKTITNENMFCDKEFTVSTVSKRKCDTMIVLSHSLKTKTKSEKNIAGFALIKTFIDDTYESENFFVNWVAFEVEYLCSHNSLVYVGKAIMNIIKLFCVAINYFHSSKTGFILYGLLKKETIAFYDRNKVLPDRPTDGRLQRRSWHIHLEPEFQQQIIETNNIKLVQKTGTTDLTLLDNPHHDVHSSSSNSGNSFWPSSKESKTKRRSQIIQQIQKLDKIPFHQRTDEQSTKLKQIRKLFASRDLVHRNTKRVIGKNKVKKNGTINKGKKDNDKEMAKIVVDYEQQRLNSKFQTTSFANYIQKIRKPIDEVELENFYRSNNFERYISLVKDYYSENTDSSSYALFWLYLDNHDETYNKEVFEKYFKFPHGDFKTFQISKEEFMSQVLKEFVDEITYDGVSEDSLNDFIDKHDFKNKYYNKSELKHYGQMLLELIILIDEYNDIPRGTFKTYFEQNAENDLGDLDYSVIIRRYKGVINLP